MLEQMNHAWRYFELHANQRISLIRYYIALYSLYISGCGYLFISPNARHLESGIVIVLSVIFVTITSIFYILDQRNRALIHFAEASLIQYESDQGLREPHNIFTIEKNDADSNNKFRHTDCFNALFLVGILTALIIISIQAFSLPL